MMFVQQAKQRVVFQHVQYIQNAEGEMVVEFQDAGTRWAKVRFLASNGQFVDEQWQGKCRMRLVIRHDMEVDLRMRVVFRNRHWRVMEVYPVGERMEFLEIIAEEE